MSYLDITFPEESTFLVTGGAGFIGSNLCEAILKMGYKVKCLDNLSNGHIENIASFFENQKFEFINGDITDFDVCNAACKNVDYVLHQAAWGSVPRSIEMPRIYEDNNIKGTLNMMDAAVNNQVKKFVYASSSSVYGDSKELPKVEGREGKVLSPYALTKKVAEMYGQMYSDLYGLETVGMRYFNVFGRRQDPNGAYAAVIPKFIRSLLKDEAPQINGDGETSRDFTYIDNVIEANLKAAISNSSVSGKTYNIAVGGRVTLNELYSKITELLGKEAIQPIYCPERVGDIRHSNADISNAVNDFSYSGSIDFSTGITNALEWYKTNI
ncbi:SDR family oxidoreductase [Enterococcus sp. DIV0756]|uniref:SDR family oxidoreductase n=1 Tax=Enterococcus sp. DIV0756 TaxID=2774636 RepID=UPI003F1F182F